MYVDSAAICGICHCSARPLKSYCRAELLVGATHVISAGRRARGRQWGAMPAARGRPGEHTARKRPGQASARSGGPPRPGDAGLSQHVPVFPDVGSMMVSPGFSVPERSASSTMRRLIRSFTLPPALKNSHLATGSQGRVRRGRGAPPPILAGPHNLTHPMQPWDWPLLAQ